MAGGSSKNLSPIVSKEVPKTPPLVTNRSVISYILELLDASNLKDLIVVVEGQEAALRFGGWISSAYVDRLHVEDQIPIWIAVVGYSVIATISVIILPHIFRQLKWYYVLILYIFAPILAFCNAYGTGLTDWSLVSTYGKLAIFTIGAWVGSANGGVLAELAACGVIMMNIVSMAVDLTQDFKIGYLTMASPRSMFISQVIGTAVGCICNMECNTLG